MEIHSIRGLSQETRKNSNKQPNFTLKELEKEQTKPKSGEGRKYCNKDQSRNK